MSPAGNPYRGFDKLPRWWTGLRGVPIALFAIPLVPTFFLALASGEGDLIAGCIAGMAGVGSAMAHLARARRGDARRAGVMLGVGTGLAAGLAGGAGPVGAVALGFMAWGGARLLYDGVTEMAPPPPPPPPRPPDALDPLRARLASLQAGDQRLLAAVSAMGGLLEEIALRPDAAGQARRVLVVGVDGLERISQRLAQGATPPETLPVLVDDLARAARQSAEDLRGAETEALAIQVKVLQDRLHQEGIA
ncbi:hypothetical protein J8J14_18890 [Roseomonas sp. SSH11]|uniref:Uncharacterized protein n=1 Tax=Pararoseomonas baculiformis TaxID=2820812 RepID=A0ABS4AIZ6_9PROT|nr:hypothetical protein [Pararoseomonas baculiformis]MBP0446846.1 hypothetical protein [Pararoseomonas baculiformis]